MERLVVRLLCVLAGAIGCGQAAAECWDGPVLFQLGTATSGTDSVPPAPPKAEVALVIRGHAPMPPQSLCGVPLDWELGFVQVHLVRLFDDVTSPEAMGVRVVPVNQASALAGDMNLGYDFRPDDRPKLSKRSSGCGEPAMSIRDESGAWFVMCWMDGGGDNQRAISEKFLVYAIDGAGNVSATADTLEVKDPGRAR